MMKNYKLVFLALFITFAGILYACSVQTVYSTPQEKAYIKTMRDIDSNFASDSTVFQNVLMGIPTDKHTIYLSAVDLVRINSALTATVVPDQFTAFHKNYTSAAETMTRALNAYSHDDLSSARSLLQQATNYYKLAMSDKPF